ncbi:MAG: hypothetical protein HFG30_01175 [Eubacterium sp.]|jgi:hypothetical protein|nr:hypothetical protein [Eubacterium sp.]
MNLEETKEKGIYEEQNISGEDVIVADSETNIEEQYKVLEPVEPSNVITGIVGALIGSLLGVALWVAIYHLGYIASIAGIAIIFCAMKGYEILGRSLDKKGVIIAAIISVIMVFAANHLAWTTEVYLELKEFGEISFLNILKRMFDFISEADIMKEYLSDLGMGYVLTLIGGISMIVKKYKQVK